MKCEAFTEWLENRDLHDVSESDKAMRHAEECEPCNRLLQKDEALDDFISQTLTSRTVPEGLQSRVDLSIDRMAPGRSKKRLLAVCAMVLVVMATVFTMNPSRMMFDTMDELGGFAVEGHLDHGHNPVKYEPVTDADSWLKANTGGGSVPTQLVAGYKVVGARFCQLGHCRAVHMVYKRQGKLVSVFMVDKDEIDFHLEDERRYSFDMDGSNVTLFRQGERVYALVA